MSKTANTETASPWDKLGITTLPMPSVPFALDILWGMAIRITLCLIGDTGIGKTPIVHQWVKKMGGFIRVLNFGHMSPEEISMAMFNDKGTEFDFVPPHWLVELNEKAEELGCAVLFLDEWNRGDKQIVNALFTLTDERRIHNFHLHPNVLVVAAMNPSDGTYMVNEAERDPAVRKRLNFVYVTADLAGWLTYAREADYHPLVIDFVRAQTNLFYDAAARDAGKAFPCPSNWEKASNICKSAEKFPNGLLSSTSRALLTGQLGHVAASKFMGFIEDKNSIIQPSEVIENYMKGGRRRVAAILGAEIAKDGVMRKVEGKNIRADVLANLNEGVAMTLYSEQPDPESVADNICQYLVDLPPDFFSSFVGEYMRKYTMTMKDGKAYTAALSSFFNKSQPYREKMAAQQAAYRAVQSSMNK